MVKRSASISVIIPVHNESVNVDTIYKKLVKYIDDDILEFVYVNDGSTDDSLERIKQLTKQDKRVRFVDFSRNFGKEAATTAGLLACVGDAAIILDCDGQHPPRLLPKFIAKWREGYEVIVGRRTSNQKAGFIKNAGSALYYWLIGLLHANSPVKGDTDFRLIDRKVIDAFTQLRDHNRVTRSLLNWLGFSTYYIDFKADERAAGTAGYSFKKLFRLAIDGMTTMSMRPLLFASVAGGFTFVLGILLGSTMLIEQFILDDPLNLGFSGTAYLAVFILITTGLLLIGQGIQGAYLANIYNESRNRPLYVIREITPPRHMRTKR